MHLIDRDVGLTFKRAGEKLGWWRRMMLASGILTSLFFDEKIEDDAIEKLKEGDMLAVGQRVGLIRFGSRVDVFLPADTVPQVVLGQRAVAGETVLGKVGGEAMSGITQ